MSQTIKINVKVDPEKAILAGKTQAGMEAFDVTPEFLAKLSERQKKIVAKYAREFHNKNSYICNLPDASESSVLVELADMELREIAREIENEVRASWNEIERKDKIVEYAKMPDEEFSIGDDWNYRRLSEIPELAEKFDRIKKRREEIAAQKEIEKEQAKEKEKLEKENFEKDFFQICSELQIEKYKDGQMSDSQIDSIIENYVFKDITLPVFNYSENKSEYSEAYPNDKQYAKIKPIKSQLKEMSYTVYEYEDSDEYGDEETTYLHTVVVRAQWHGREIAREFVL